jgi:hypothetical protein
VSDIYTVQGRMAATPTIPATVLLIVAGTQKRLWVHEILVSSTTATASASAEFTVGRPTTSGTGGAAVTPQPEDAAAQASLFTALSSSTAFSAEPTQPAAYIDRVALNTLTSYLYVPKFPILVAVSTRLAVRVEADSTATKVQWIAQMTVEE